MTQRQFEQRAAGPAPATKQQRTYACKKCGGPAKRGKGMSPAASAGMISGLFLIVSPFFPLLAIVGVIGLILTLIIALGGKKHIVVECADCGHNFNVPKPSAERAAARKA